MRIFYTIIIVGIVIFIISFSLQNSSDVPLKYYELLNVTLPSYMLMFVSFLVGVIFTGLMGLSERLNLTKTIRQLNKTVRDLRRELRIQETFAEVAEDKEAKDALEQDQQ